MVDFFKRASFTTVVCFVLTSNVAFGQGARITEVSVFDRGEAAASSSFDVSIDTVQNDCAPGAETPDPEPFFDTVLGLAITNPSFANLRISSVRYRVARVDGGRSFRSQRIAPVGPLEVAAGEAGFVFVPILTADGGVKRFSRGELTTANVVGFRTLSVRIVGRSGNRRVRLRAKTTVSFGDFNRCSG